MDDDIRVDGWKNLTHHSVIGEMKKQHDGRKRRESGMQAAEESNDRGALPA